MKLTCIRSNHEIVSRIIGNDQAAFADVVEQLANHVKARFPDEMKELALMSHVAVAYMLLLKADWAESETFIQKIWDEHQEQLFNYLELDEYVKEAGEEDVSEAYDIGFEDCKRQIVAFVKSKSEGLCGGMVGSVIMQEFAKLADEIDAMTIEEEAAPEPVGIDTTPQA